ncbi:hypothetical protein BDQ17DRAFT_1367252 [Cyathus striatus]|nr:hypothetical protein BDQ17DRAFT_1367252 [Cyathus striatus]
MGKDESVPFSVGFLSSPLCPSVLLSPILVLYQVLQYEQCAYQSLPFSFLFFLCLMAIAPMLNCFIRASLQVLSSTSPFYCF